MLKSLVSVDSAHDKIRYRLLESLRLYALTKLLEGDDADKTRARHAQYWYERSVGCYNDQVDMPTREWQRMHGAEIADIRAALEWSFGPTGDPSLGIKITAASALLWFKVLLQPELRRYLEHAIRLSAQVPEVDDGVIMNLYLALGRSIVHAGGSERELREALDQAFVIAERRNDILGQLQAIWTRWGQTINSLDFSTMTRELERAHAIVVNRPEFPVASLYYDRIAALSYHMWGDQETALRHAQQALEQAESVRRDRRGTRSSTSKRLSRARITPGFSGSTAIRTKPWPCSAPRSRTRRTDRSSSAFFCHLPRYFFGGEISLRPADTCRCSSTLESTLTPDLPHRQRGDTYRGSSRP